MEQSQYPQPQPQLQLQLQLQLLAVLQKKQATISAAMDVLNDGFTNGLMDTKSERTHYAHALLVTNLLMDIGPKSGSAEDLAAVPAADIVQLNDYLDNVDFSISMWVNDPKLSEADLLKQLADNVQRHDYSRFSLLGESAYDIAKAKSTELATLIPTIQAQLPAPAPTPAPSVSSPQARVAAPVPDEHQPPQSSFQRQPSPIRTRGSDLSNALAGGIRNVVNAAKITGDFLSRNADNADNADNVDLDEVNLKISEHLNSPEVQAERDAQAADNFVNSVKNDNDVGHMKKLAEPEQHSADIDRLHATGKSPVNSKDVFDTLDLMSMLREYNIARDVEYVRDALEKYPRDVVMNSISSVRDAHYMKDLTENYLDAVTDVEARKRQGKIEGAQNLMGALGELGSLANPGNWTKKSDNNNNSHDDGADDDNDVALAAAAVVNTTAKALKNSDYGVFDYDSPEYDVNTNTNTTALPDTTTSDPAPTDEIGAANEEAVTKNLADLHETGTEQIAKAVESGALTPEEGAAKLKELNALMDESAKKNKEAHDRSKTAAERIEAQNELSKAMHQVGAMIGALFNYLLRILTLGKYGTPGAGAPDAGANTNGAATPVGTTPNPNPNVATPVVAATPAGAANVVTSKEGSETKVAPSEVVVVPTITTPVGTTPTTDGDAPDVVTKPQAKAPTKNKLRGM